MQFQIKLDKEIGTKFTYCFNVHLGVRYLACNRKAFSKVVYLLIFPKFINHIRSHLSYMLPFEAYYDKKNA